MTPRWLHHRLVSAPRAPVVDVHGKVMVVTGAAAGSIGGDTARILASWGAEVVTTTRSGGAGAHALDLTDRASVAAFASWFLQDHGRLDVLVNNAGVHLDLLSRWKEPHLLDDGEEVHWRTNYLGTMHLTQLLLPALTGTPGSRVVNVVSKLHVRGTNSALLSPPERYHSWDAYGRSKLALMHATTELTRRHPGVLAVSVHPGEVFTGIATKGLAGHRVLGAARRALRPVERLILMTPEEGAQTSVYCASQPHLRPGAYYARCRVAKHSPDVDDAAVAGQLWDRTQVWLAAG